MTRQYRGGARPGRGFVVVLSGLAFAAGGCQLPEVNLPFLASRQEREDKLLSIDRIRGPMERVLPASAEGRAATGGSLSPAEGIAEYEQADALFRDGQFDPAEKEFKRLAKKYKASQVEEDSRFMIAECQFERQQFAKAEDTYGRLLKDFPSTRHLDRVTRRLFQIAQSWLEFPQIVNADEIQQVNFENPRETPPPPLPGNPSNDPTRRVPILPNFVDRSRPMFDTDGRALEALKAIWMHDPTGPLADDAIMLTASHHLRKGNYMEAARHYDMLREQFPRSDHLKEAFVLGAHATAMSHQGALYDGESLDKSRELKDSAVRLFPDEVDRERLLDEVRRIDEEKARSEWANVEYWQKKNDPLAIAAACREVIRLYPNTTYAAESRHVLGELNPAAPDEPRRLSLPFLNRDRDEYDPPGAEPPPAVYPGADAAPGRSRL